MGQEGEVRQRSPLSALTLQDQEDRDRLGEIGLLYDSLMVQNPLCHQNQAIKVNQRKIKICPTKSWLTTTSSSGTVEVLGVIEKTELLISKYSPAAICLQETMLKRYQIQTFKHYSAYYKDSITGHGGVCILVKNNFIHSQVQFQADLQAVAVCITINNKAYTVASVYVPPSETQWIGIW